MDYEPSSAFAEKLLMSTRFTPFAQGFLHAQTIADQEDVALAPVEKALSEFASVGLVEAQPERPEMGVTYRPTIAGWRTRERLLRRHGLRHPALANQRDHDLRDLIIAIVKAGHIFNERTPPGFYGAPTECTVEHFSVYLGDYEPDRIANVCTRLAEERLLTRRATGAEHAYDLGILGSKFYDREVRGRLLLAADETILDDLLVTEITVFYAWQAEFKDSRKVIDAVLPKVLDELNKLPGVLRQLKLVLATEAGDGAVRIDQQLLERVRCADFFIGDVTPILMHEDRLRANDNVLIETGYALASKTPEQIILLAMKRADLPAGRVAFDIAMVRRHDFGSKDHLRMWLRKELEAALRRRGWLAMPATEPVRAKGPGRIAEAKPIDAHGGVLSVLTFELERLQDAAEARGTAACGGSWTALIGAVYDSAQLKQRLEELLRVLDSDREAKTLLRQLFHYLDAGDAAATSAPPNPDTLQVRDLRRHSAEVAEQVHRCATELLGRIGARSPKRQTPAFLAILDEQERQARHQASIFWAMNHGPKVSFQTDAETRQLRARCRRVLFRGERYNADQLLDLVEKVVADASSADDEFAFWGLLGAARGLLRETWDLLREWPNCPWSMEDWLPLAERFATLERAHGETPHRFWDEGGVVNVYDEQGTLLGTATYMPPGQNGLSDPLEGLLMGAPPAVKNGGRYAIEVSGRRISFTADRSAGGGAFIMIFGMTASEAEPVQGGTEEAPNAWIWDQDSEWYHVGMRLGPEGGVWADKAIAARGTSRDKAFEYARKALETNRTAWSAWYSAFTGIPVT